MSGVRALMKKFNMNSIINDKKLYSIFYLYLL